MLFRWPASDLEKMHRFVHILKHHHHMGNEINVSQWQVAAKTGFFIGLALIAYSALLYILGIDPQSSANYINYIILITGLAYGIIHYRDKFNNRLISYGRAVGYGVQLSFFSGLILSFYLFLFFSFIDKEFISNMLEKIEENYFDAGLEEEQIEMAMSMMRKIYTPYFLSLFSVLGNVIVGLIFSLILAIFLKKENGTDSSFEKDLA